MLPLYVLLQDTAEVGRIFRVRQLAGPRQVEIV